MSTVKTKRHNRIKHAVTPGTPIQSLPAYHSGSETQQSHSVYIRPAGATDTDGGGYTDILQYKFWLNVILLKVKVTLWDRHRGVKSHRYRVPRSGLLTHRKGPVSIVLGGLSGRSGRVRKTSFAPGFYPHAFQPLAKRCTDFTTLHYTTLHYTTLHHITLHYTTLHYTTPHYTTLHYPSHRLCL